MLRLIAFKPLFALSIAAPIAAAVQSFPAKQVTLVLLDRLVNLANMDARTIYDTEALGVGLGTAGPLPA